MFELSQVAKWLIYIGLALVLFGIIFFIAVKWNLPIGKLPGDIKLEKGKFGFYFPIVTSLVISIGLTLIINLVFYLFRK